MKKLRDLFRPTPASNDRREVSAGRSGNARLGQSGGSRRGRPHSGGGRRNQTRRLGSESLEKRQLLAGDLGTQDYNPEHNYFNRHDVDDDSQITVMDALAVINRLRSQATLGEAEATGPSDDSFMTDVNNDFRTTPQDALNVINAIRRGEAVGEPLIFDLIAIDNDGNEIAEVDGVYQVTTGQDITLVVSYIDDRAAPATQSGLARVAADLVEGTFVGTTFTPADDADDVPLTPLLGEVQQYVIMPEILNAIDNGTVTTIRVTNPDDTSQTFSVTTDASDPNAVATLPGINNILFNAISEFGFVPGTDFEIVDNFRDATIQRITIAFDEINQANVDIPNFLVEFIPGSFDDDSYELTAQPPRLAGQANDPTIPFAIITENESIDVQVDNQLDLRSSEEAYLADIFGSGTFDPVRGFEDLSVVTFDQTSIADRFGDANAGIPFPEPFPAFAIPIQFDSVISNAAIQIGLPVDETPNDNVDSPGNVFYDTPADAVLGPNDVLIGERALARFNVTQGVVTDIVLTNGVLSLTEDGGPQTLDLQTLAGTQTGLTFGTTDTSAFGTIDITNNILTFTPNADAFTPAGVPEQITVTATDGTRNGSATVSITIDPVNDAPVAVDDSGAGLGATAGTPLTISAARLTDNDSPGAGEADTLTVVSVDGSGLTGATVSLDGDVITFTPEATATGQLTFEYTVSDGALTDTASVTVDVASVNNPPVITDAAFTIDEDAQAVQVDISSVFSGGAPTDTTVTAPAGVVASISGTTLTITPVADSVEDIPLAITASNGFGNASGTVTINVTQINDPPTADAESFTTAEDTQLVIQISELLDGDSPGPANENQTVSLAGFQTPTTAGGTITQSGDTLIYTPAANVSGTDTFTYTISDGIETATATVTVNVTPVVDLPVLGNDSVGVLQGQTVTFDLSSLNAGPDPATTFTATTNDAGISIATSGNIVSITGVAQSTATITVTGTNTAGSASGTLTVNVSETNVAPRLTGGPIVQRVLETPAADPPVTIDLLSPFVDDNGDALTIAASTLPTDTAGITVNSDGTATVDPDAFASLAFGQTQVITFDYTVTDGEFNVDNTATITIVGSGDITAGGNETVRISVPQVSTLTTGTFTGTPTLSDTSLGTVAIDNGDLVFTAAPGVTSSGTITVNIDGQPDPVVIPIIVVEAQGTVSGQLFRDEIDPDNVVDFINGNISYDQALTSRDADGNFLTNGSGRYLAGRRDTGEDAFSSIPVRLFSVDASGVQIPVSQGGLERFTLSDINGNYAFEDVPPGQYEVEVLVPDSIRFDGISASPIVVTTDGGASQQFEGPQITPAELSTSLGYLDLLASSYLRNNRAIADMSMDGLQGGTVAFGDNGVQELFIAGQGFEDIEFAQFTVNGSQTEALLTVVRRDASGNLSIEAARLDQDLFLLAEDGSAARFFGAMEDFDFESIDDPGTTAGFDNFRDAVDMILANL